MQSPSSDIVKVAIQANNKAVLFVLEQHQPLETIIQNVCCECGVTFEKNKFSLQLLPQVSEEGQFVYVTEFNRYLIKNGRELRLVYSAPVLANLTKEKLAEKSSTESLTWALKKAAICSSDASFCKEFFTVGYATLRKLLNDLLLTESLYNNALKIILNLIRSKYLTELDKDMLLQLKQIITSDHHIDEGVIETTLNVLEAIVISENESELLLKILSLDEFAHHIWCRDYPQVQCRTLSLINTLVLKSKRARTQKHLLAKMNSKHFKDNIYSNVISSEPDVPSSLAHSLFLYQSLILTMDKQRYRNLITSDSLQIDSKQNLIPNPNQTKINHNNSIGQNFNLKKVDKDYFRCQDSEDIVNCPPKDNTLHTSEEETDDSVFEMLSKQKNSNKEKYISQLTFDCVFYFHTKYIDNYQLAMLEEGNNFALFLQTCDQIVQMICVKVLLIGNIPDVGQTSFCPLVFVTSSPFLEELFSRAISLLLKTKREMKARNNSSDLQKVMKVVQRQLQEALKSKPLSYERLDEALAHFSYNKVRSQWHEEQLERERLTLAQSPAVQQLRQSLVPEILALIKKQRLKFLKKGSEFPVWNPQRNQRVKNKTWFACLTPNEKAIQYRECDGVMKQLQIENITSLLTGRQCPHIKQKSRATNEELAFSLTTEESSLDFIVPTQEIYDHWTDGINAILGNEMKSISKKRDMNCMLEIEVRLRLLDTDGIELPTNPPPVPLEPPNYDFCLP